MKGVLAVSIWASFSFVWIISGCLLGIGFVSGVEINKFFGGCGKWGYALIAVSLFVAILTLYRLAVLTKNGKSVFPNGLNTALNVIRALFMLSLLTYSVSSAEEILKCLGACEKFPLGSLMLVVVIALLCLAKGQCVLKIFGIGVPLIALFCVCYRIVCGGNGNSAEIITKTPLSAVGGAILLASYNVLAGMDAVIRFARNTNSKVLASSVFAGAILWLCGWAILSSTGNSQAMPMLKRILEDSSALGIVFAGVMMASLIGTGVSWTVGLSDMINKNSALVPVAVCTVAFVGSLLGFDSITSVIYPAFGAVGVALVVYINVIYAKRTVKLKKNKY